MDAYLDIIYPDYTNYFKLTKLTTSDNTCTNASDNSNESNNIHISNIANIESNIFELGYDSSVQNELSQFLNKYNINRNDLLFSKLKFLDCDQQMYLIHSWYRYILHLSIPRYDKMVIYFHNELEYQINRIRDKSITHASITHNFLMPKDNYKLYQLESIVALSAIRRNTNQFIVSNTVDNNINLLIPYKNKFKYSSFDITRIYTLETTNVNIHLFMYNDTIFIALNTPNNSNPIFCQEIKSYHFFASENNYMSCISYVLELNHYNIRDEYLPRIKVFIAEVKKYEASYVYE